MSEQPNHGQSIDELLVRSIARWALLIAGAILAFDLAVVQGYPFPGSSQTLRGLFYTLAFVALLAGTAFVTFLGYRIVTLGVICSRRSLYAIFLPAALTLGSILSFLFLAAPG
jgi:hypothetical protein